MTGSSFHYRLPCSLLTSCIGNPASGSWGYSQGQSTDPIPGSQLQETSRPSSTNPYTSASIQAFDRAAGTSWQTANLDPSDFPALGSGSTNVSHVPSSTPSYASTAGTGSVHQQRLQQQLYARQGGSTDDYSLSEPFSPDEFPALGGMSDGHSQRQGIPQHLGGQSNGVYDPRQQGAQQIMTPSPNLAGSQSVQQVQDHRASMLEALQGGQRGPSRSGASSNVPDPRSYPGDDQKVYNLSADC